MCIRDRVTAAGGAASAAARGSENENVDPAPGADSTHSVPPVSYTHLRAHETVLDLVCRLLLEKKNKHKIHTHHSKYA